MDDSLFKDTKIDNSNSMDHTPPRKKRKVDESLQTIKKKHKDAKSSGADKLRKLYSAAKSLADLDDSFSEPTQHQPECDNSLYREFMENSQERISDDLGTSNSESSSTSIDLVSSSNSGSWSSSSGSSLDSGTSSSYRRSQSPFWKSVAAAKIQKTPKNQSVDDFFDVQKDYLPFEEEKTEWADDTYLKQIVCCCFFKWK